MLKERIPIEVPLLFTLVIFAASEHLLEPALCLIELFLLTLVFIDLKKSIGAPFNLLVNFRSISVAKWVFLSFLRFGDCGLRIGGSNLSLLVEDIRLT